jgi:pyruvate dehydrogenase E1 component alpha subunit
MVLVFMVKKQAFSGGVDYFQVLNEDGQVDAALDPKLSDSVLKNVYENMVLCRLLDQKAISLQRQGRMYTYAPLLGQEAAQVGAFMALSKTDWIFPSYRDHGSYICRGAPLNKLFEYYMGFEEGMAVSNDLCVFPVAITVGNHLPLAAGYAWAQKLKKEKALSLVCFGDGATSEGDFHESLNVCAVHRLPCIFFCQNNQWAISVPVHKQMACKTIAQKALAYGAQGVQVDGNDVLAVYSAVKKAQADAYAGKGPTLIEAVTYRMTMHTTADDPKKYRSENEVLDWKKKDPVMRFERYLESKKLFDESYKKKVEGAAKIAIEKGVQLAEAFSGKPETMFDFVFAEKPWHLVEQKEAFLRGE